MRLGHVMCLGHDPCAYGMECAPRGLISASQNQFLTKLQVETLPIYRIPHSQFLVQNWSSSRRRRTLGAFQEEFLSPLHVF